MIYISYICAPGYDKGAKHFAETYVKHPAEYPHELVLVNTHGGLNDTVASYFDTINHTRHDTWTGGWDIGAHQHFACSVAPQNWIMCFSSWAHFDRPGWLKAFVDARRQFGEGLYGSTASLENNIHLRGTGFFVRADAIHNCPIGVNSRPESHEWENRSDNFTIWCMKTGIPPRLVAPSGVYEASDFRKPENGFRSGDQSDIWTRDKYTLLYDQASPMERSVLNARSNGTGI